MLERDYSYSIFGTWDIFFREMIGDLGELDELKEEVVNQHILYIFFLIATLILYIAMLNLLIAIISDTFSDVKKAEKRTKIWEKWNIITEIDMMLYKSETEKPENGYLMYIYNEKHVKEENEKGEEKELDKIIEANHKKYQQYYENLSSEIVSMEERFLDEIEELKTLIKNKN